jgi:hypothetical protein
MYTYTYTYTYIFARKALQGGTYKRNAFFFKFVLQKKTSESVFVLSKKKGTALGQCFFCFSSANTDSLY